MRVLTIAVTIAFLHHAAQPSVWAHAGGSQGDRWAQEFCKASFCGIMSSSKWELCCEGHGECCAYLQLEAGGGGSSERVSSSSKHNSGSSYTHGVQPPPTGPQQLPKPQRLSSHPQPPSFRPLSQPKPPSIRPPPPSIRPPPPSIRPDPPSTRSHPPSSQPYPPSSQPHPPSSHPHPPSSQPHPLSHPEPPPGRLPSRPHFQRFETGRRGLKKASSKLRKVTAQDSTSLLVAPEQLSDNEVYSAPAPKTKDRWGEEFCRVSYCGIMPSVKWQHCCENFGQCCVYLLLAKPKDLKSPFAFQEIATVTQPKRKFEYGFSHRPQHAPGSSKAQDNRLKTFLYSPQEKPVQTAPSTPKAAIKHVTTSSGPVVVKQPFRPQRQASYYNEVYAMEGDKWGREYCRTSYCSIMPSSKWAHCCDNYRKCCAYVHHTQDKDMKNPFAYEEISIFSIPLRPPRIRPIPRVSPKEVQADEPQASTHRPTGTDQLPSEGPQPPPEAAETPQGSPAPKPQPWRDHKPGNYTAGPETPKDRTRDSSSAPPTPQEQTPDDPQPAEDRRLRYDVDRGTPEEGTESSPIVVPLPSETPVLDRALDTFNDVVAKEEARRCRPRYCAILSPEQWRSCCSRYRQCCAYARYLEPRGPFHFEEDPAKIH